MRAILLFVSLVALVCAKENVLTLTTDIFDSTIKSENIILVEFYAPWCGHCKSLAPEYEKAAGELLKNSPPVPLAKVDATIESELASRFGISGYPTLKIFRNGEASDYNGPRDAAGIVSYMKNQAGPSSRTFSTEEAAEAFLSKATDVVVLGLFSDPNSAKAKTFLKTASTLRDSFTFADSSVESLFTKYGVTDGVALIQPPFYKSKQEKMVLTTTDVPSSVTLKSWITKNSLPLVGALNEDTQERYNGANKAILTLWANIDFARDPKGSNYVANRLRKVAENYPEIVFTVGDIRSRLASGVLTQHGLTTSDLFGVTIKGKDGGKFVFNKLVGQKEGSLKVDGLSEFVDEFLAGKVEPFLKSEAIPKQSTVDGVTTLVGKSFKSEIEESGKPALIEFYAPWCGHCKQLAPTWDKLGKQFEDDDVVIAKMDSTANDAPANYEVRGFPTIYYKSATGQPEKYQGGRELDDFVKFLKEKGIKSGKGKKEL